MVSTTGTQYYHVLYFVLVVETTGYVLQTYEQKSTNFKEKHIRPQIKIIKKIRENPLIYG